MASTTPAITIDTSWWDGQLPLRVAAHVGRCDAPDELITSIRCIVVTPGGLVRCTNRDGSHVMPGGRREAGESFEETAVREVAEETGWQVDPASLRLLGWMHFEYLTPRPDDWQFPHPDFIQLIYAGTATDRAEQEDGTAWTDTDGWEERSDVVPLDALEADELTVPFVDLLR